MMALCTYRNMAARIENLREFAEAGGVDVFVGNHVSPTTYLVALAVE